MEFCWLFVMDVTIVGERVSGHMCNLGVMGFCCGCMLGGKGSIVGSVRWIISTRNIVLVTRNTKESL